MTTDDDDLQDDDSGSSDDQTLVTKEGLKKLNEELHELKKVRRQEVAKRLKEAISYGDLSENAEYEEAKNEQAFVEGRIIELESKIKNAHIISANQKTSTKSKIVDLGTTVTVRNKSDNSDPETYTIVGSTEANPLDHKISNESPIGKSFLGHKKGDAFEVNTPGGILKYEILKVE